MTTHIKNHYKKWNVTKDACDKRWFMKEEEEEIENKNKLIKDEWDNKLTALKDEMLQNMKCYKTWNEIQHEMRK